ncbi:hypothetical protein ACQKWADRAFT_177572 [Trichoderma austrokoningii]
MVLLEHLPLLGLALGLAHLHHGRVSHSHPPHLNQATVPQISDGSSQLHQAPPPRLIAARESDESHGTTIQVTQTHLQGILDRIKSLEEEISSMMVSRANSFLDSSLTPVQHAALDPDDIEFSKATMAAMKTAKLAATTKTTTGAVVGGLFKEASVDLNQQSTVTITSTTHITRMVTILPTTIVTITTISTKAAKESKFKALIPFSSQAAAAIPISPKPTSANGLPIRPFSSSLSASTSVSTSSVETVLRQPKTTSHRFNSSMTFHHPSLPMMSSGFLTVRRAA